jgi:hypothetical protein
VILFEISEYFVLDVPVTHARAQPGLTSGAYYEILTLPWEFDMRTLYLSTALFNWGTADGTGLS